MCFISTDDNGDEARECFFFNFFQKHKMTDESVYLLIICRYVCLLFCLLFVSKCIKQMQFKQTLFNLSLKKEITNRKTLIGIRLQQLFWLTTTT